MVDLIFLFVLIGMTVVATIVIMARAHFAREEKRATDRTWAGFAKARLDAASQPREKAGSLLGELPTREPVRLLALGTDGARYTVLEAQLPDAICARLVCSTEKRKPGAKSRSVAVAPMFDQVFRTETSPESLARQTLTTDVQRRLVAFAMGQPLRFAYERGWVSLKWPGHEQNRARLEEALGVLTLATATFRKVYRAPMTDAA